jgi:aminoglycoside phosphotransferase (APT) family kinase protein
MHSVRQIIAKALAGATITTVRRLTGGVSAQTHLVRFDNHEDVVVRQFTAPWHREEPAATYEAHALHRTAAPGLTVPRLIWADTTGEVAGHPSLVISRIAGTIRARPSDDLWLTGLAGFLARLHRVRPTAADRRVLHVDLGAHRPWLTHGALPSHRAVGRLVWPAVQEAFAQYSEPAHTLLHGDFHPANVLNVRGRVSGVIDWEAAMVGPPAYDVGYCRMDLTIAHGQEVGDAFVDAYALASGSRPAELRTFTLVAILRAAPQIATWIPAWEASGCRGLTPAVVRRRLAAFARRIVTSS